MSLFDKLDPVQQEAVRATEGPMAVYAGAGSGKTRVMTHRVAYMIEQGISPESILCITFTNKAANEMKKRINKLVGDTRGMWIGTFHKTCSMMLRMFAAPLHSEYKSFTVLDDSGQRSVLKNSAAAAGYEEKNVKSLQERIAFAKQNLMGPKEYYKYCLEHMPRDAEMFRKIYSSYEEKLKNTNSLDFEDLLLKMVQVLRENQFIRDQINSRFRYVSVDEYQDVSYLDSILIELLAGDKKNLMAIGDPRQTIFQFRASDMRFLMNFTEDYNARLFILNTNYRSGAKIVSAAESLVSHNELRPDYTCNPAKGGGSVMIREFAWGGEEAKFVASEIKRLHNTGIAYEDIAILYRVNAMRTVFEPVFIERQIPYNIVNGIQFADRKSVQDVACYLRLLINSDDDRAAVRAMGIPSRGIGEGMLGQLRQLADSRAVSLYRVISNPKGLPVSPRASRCIEKFRAALSDLQSSYNSGATVSDLVDGVLALGFEEHYQSSDRKAADKHLEAIHALIDHAQRYPGPASETLFEFLEDLALGAEVDEGDPVGVRLMTVHASKGLEFKAVFVVGCDEGLFPHTRSSGSREGVEEERRLLYVAMTRGIDHLYLTSAFSRVLHGSPRDAMPSPFLREIN